MLVFVEFQDILPYPSPCRKHRIDSANLAGCSSKTMPPQSCILIIIIITSIIDHYNNNFLELKRYIIRVIGFRLKIAIRWDEFSKIWEFLFYSNQLFSNVNYKSYFWMPFCSNLIKFGTLFFARNSTLNSFLSIHPI